MVDAPVDDRPSVGETGNAEKSDSATAKGGKPKEKKPLTVAEGFFFLCMGGQFVYLTAASVVAHLTQAVLGEETAARLDSLFTPEGSAARRVVDTAQLAVRSVVAGASLVGGAGFLLLGTLAVGAAGGGYLWLSTEGGDLALLKKNRRDIVTLFLLGIPPGWIFWRMSGAITGKPPQDFIYPSMCLLLALSGGLFKYASDEQKRADAGLRKKRDPLAEAAGGIKIGTVSVDGGEEQDVTVKDALGAAARLASSKDDRVEQWAQKREIALMKMARMGGGVLYGYSLRVVWFFFSITALPIVRNIVLGEESFLLSYWLRGMRASLDFSALAEASS